MAPCRTTAFAAGVCTFVILTAAVSLRAEEIAQWNLEGDLSSMSGHGALAAEAGPPANTGAFAFEDVAIAGRESQAAAFAAGTYFRAPLSFAPNGGGIYVNQYTIILDVMWPAGTDAWQAIFQTNETNANDGDWFVEPDADGSGVGISGNYGGTVTDGTWHRLALVVDLVEGTFVSYIDGEEVQRNDALAPDGRFSLGETVLFFADDTGETSAGLVDAIQVRDVALCPEDVASFGSPADGALTRRSFPGSECRPDVGSLTIKEGPYLQWLTRSQVTVMWETNVASNSTVRFDRGGGEESVTDDAEVTIHEVRLGGFQPGEVVLYSVHSRAGDDEIASGEHSFETAPPDPVDFNFVVWGDNQANPSVFGRLVEDMVTRDPALAVAAGDVVDNGNSYTLWGRELLTPVFPLASSVPFYVAIGNHEADSHWFYDYIAQPGNEHWFSFDYADCHFVIIDTNYPFSPGSEQYTWLEQDLFSEAAQSAKWLFAFHHHPPYSEIYEETVYGRARAHLVPLLETAGVDIDFTGHIHDYERGVYVPPDTGRRICYIQTSGAGGRLWEDEFDGDWEQIEKVIQYVHHYCLIEISGETLTLTALNLEGDPIDRVVLTETPREGRPPPGGGDATTQWDFGGGDLASSFGPGRMEFVGDTATVTGFGTTTTLGIPAIADDEAAVMEFPAFADNSRGFKVETNADPNRGDYINDYTLVLDLLIPTESFATTDWLALYNTNAENSNDADLFVRLSDGAVGIAGVFDGKLEPDTWHRLAIVHGIEGERAVLRKYVDGQLVGTQFVGGIDERWSLYSRVDATPWFWLFADDSGETARGYLSSMMFSDRAFTEAEIAELDGPDSGGILDLACPPGEDCSGPRFVRGDADGDGRVLINDAVRVLNYLFVDGSLEPGCLKALDANDSGSVQLSDAVWTLNWLFGGGAPPPDPGAQCGTDPTEDELECSTTPTCGF